jgi:hypothetical protein
LMLRTARMVTTNRARMRSGFIPGSFAIFDYSSAPRPRHKRLT